MDDVVDSVELDVNRQTHCQIVGQWGLSGGGGVCPMCRLSDGEKGAQHNEYERTQSATQRDCRHAAVQSGIYV